MLKPVSIPWNGIKVVQRPAVRQLSGARLGVGKAKCYDLSIHVMQAGRSNGDLSISMGPLLLAAKGFASTTCREGITRSRRGFVKLVSGLCA